MTKLDAVHEVEHAFDFHRPPSWSTLRDIYLALSGCEAPQDSSAESLWNTISSAYVGGHFAAAYVDDDGAARAFLGFVERREAPIREASAQAPAGQKLVELDLLQKIKIGDRLTVGKDRSRGVVVAFRSYR